MTRRTHLRISADNNSPADAIRARPSSLPSPSPPPLSHHCANFSFFNLASLPLPPLPLPSPSPSPPPDLCFTPRFSFNFICSAPRIPDERKPRRSSSAGPTRAPKRVRNFPAYLLNQFSTERVAPSFPLRPSAPLAPALSPSPRLSQLARANARASLRVNGWRSRCVNDSLRNWTLIHRAFYPRVPSHAPRGCLRFHTTHVALEPRRAVCDI